MIYQRKKIRTSIDNALVTVEAVIWPFPRKKIVTLINRPRVLPYIDRHDPVLASNIQSEMDDSLLSVCFDVKDDFVYGNKPNNGKYSLFQLCRCYFLVSTDPTVAFKAKFRRELKRRTKRLAELGTLKFSCVKAQDIDAARFAGFYGFLKESREIRGIRTRWGLEKNKKVLGQIICFTGSLLFELTVNDKPIAFAHCQLVPGGLIYLIPSYDSKYSKYSPGMLLLSYIMKYCEEENLVLDLGKGDTGYKKHFQTDSYPLHAAFVYSGLIGRMLSIPLKCLLRTWLEVSRSFRIHQTTVKEWRIQLSHIEGLVDRTGSK